jgi:hypothetical protein
MIHPRFTVEKFESLIATRGKLLRWERAKFCPCYDAASRAADESCPRCDGFGYTFSDQGTFTGTILGMAASKSYAKFGEWLAGDAVLTFPSTILIGDRDRITVTEDVYRETDRLVRGRRDTLIEPNVLQVIECEDENRAYLQDEDFDLNGPRIVWRPGMGPADGATYSVLYTGRPVFVVFMQLPQHRAKGKGGREMPRKVALRRWLDWTREA